MKYSGIFFFVLTVSMVAACSAQPPVTNKNDHPISSEDTSEPTEIIDTDRFEITESALLESMDIVFLESFPLQVHVILTGNFPDGCTFVQSHKVTREDNHFNISVFTKRPSEALCTEALVPFEYTVFLDVYGLPAGDYSVSAYNVSDSFTFKQDNFEPGKNACTLYPGCGDQ